MTYYNLKRKKKLPNRKVDKFLVQLQTFFKKHDMMLINKDKNLWLIEAYDSKQFDKMIRNIGDDTTEVIIEDESDANPTI